MILKLLVSQKNYCDLDFKFHLNPTTIVTKESVYFKAHLNDSAFSNPLLGLLSS